MRSRRLFAAGFGLLAVLAAAEMTCRYVIGLGDAPLSEADPQMEYLFQPSQTCHPLHHLVHINRYSMRSDDFPAHKSNGAELRVMVVGDSVVYDGVQIDQHDICTEVLKRQLARDLHRPVVVGNISAKSWGPPNELAYVQRFGLFNADVVVVVLNSHDYADVPTHRPIVDHYPDYPSHKPPLALVELWQKTIAKPSYDAIEPSRRSRADEQWALSAEGELYRIAKSIGARVFLVQMREKVETDGHLLPGYAANLQVARDENVPVIPVGGIFQAQLRSGANPYLDRIHPNQFGCQIMGDSMAAAIESDMRNTAP